MNSKGPVKNGQLLIWHNSNFGQTGFEFPVESAGEAKKLLRLLAEYDLYLGEKIVGANAQGLLVYDRGEWLEWEDAAGNQIDEVEEVAG